MYVILGASGNTGSRIAQALLTAGKNVTVVGREAEKLNAFAQKGAKVAIGDLSDTTFLAQTFQGATAVYALIPPTWNPQASFREYQQTVGKSIAEALRQAQVKKVVVLSSNGAHLPEGTGVVAGLYDFEQMLKNIPNLDVMSLRAGYFMENLFGVIGMIKQLGFFGYTLQSEIKFPIVHTKDIAEVATKQLLSLNFNGFNHVFVAGQRDLSMAEVAKVLADATQNPDLKYIPFTEDTARAGMLQSGIPATIVEGYLQLFDALNKGIYLNDYQRTAENTTPTSIEHFAQEFAHVYKQS